MQRNAKNKKRPPSLCAFCGKGTSEVGYLIEGNALGSPVCICSICHNTCDHIFSFKFKNQKRTFSNNYVSSKLATITPRKIKEHLDSHIIGQDNAKMALSISVTNHYKRIFAQKSNSNPYKDVVLEKSNVLFVGPTGSGKTLLIKKLAEFLEVPLAIGDATSLTEAGYVGEDVESIVTNLYYNADSDVKRTEKGIIYIDEIDKIAKSRGNVSITRDVSGEGVQQGLLKLIEGSLCNVSPNGGRKHPEQRFLRIDTTNILFIVGGTFVGIDDIIKRRNGHSMGFSSSQSNFVDNKVLPEDLVEFGMIPEFIGRFPLIQRLEKLGVKDLISILKEPKNSIVKQYQKMFYLDNVELIFTNDSLEEIAGYAVDLETGARGLKQIMERVLFDYSFNIDNYKNHKIEITKDYVVSILNKKN